MSTLGNHVSGGTGAAVASAFLMLASPAQDPGVVRTSRVETEAIVIRGDGGKTLAYLSGEEDGMVLVLGDESDPDAGRIELGTERGRSYVELIGGEAGGRARIDCDEGGSRVTLWATASESASGRATIEGGKRSGVLRLSKGSPFVVGEKALHSIETFFEVDADSYLNEAGSARGAK